MGHISVFQPFCCRRTLHKHEGHSRNPMHWSMCSATYAKLKLWGVYRLISLAGHWGQNRWGRQSRQRLTIIIWNLITLVGNSMLILYLTKHDKRGGRRRPLSPATNPENLSRKCSQKRQAYVSF